jgi:hypothetical protein
MKFYTESCEISYSLLEKEYLLTSINPVEISMGNVGLQQNTETSK